MGGGSGGASAYKAPEPTPMPIEDSTAARSEVAQMVADRQSGASRTANDLGGPEANKDEAVTRKKLGMADNLAPQQQPRGPMGRRAPRVPAGGMNASAVLTG
jgi:hypothetical protein